MVRKDKPMHLPKAAMQPAALMLFDKQLFVHQIFVQSYNLSSYPFIITPTAYINTLEYHAPADNGFASYVKIFFGVNR